jgi:hypothetical protein
MACPRDTDGDGNCGNPRCPYCGKGSRISRPLQEKQDLLVQLIDQRIELAFKRRADRDALNNVEPSPFA